MAKQTKPKGRPKHPTIIIGIRFTREERDKLRKDAANAGQTISGRVTFILRNAGAL